MSERIPCPLCGTENEPTQKRCRVCAYRLVGTINPDDKDSGKCARCGGLLGEGFEFCQVCGLRVQSRHPRPRTERLRVVASPGESAEHDTEDIVQGRGGRTGTTQPTPVSPRTVSRDDPTPVDGRRGERTPLHDPAQRGLAVTPVATPPYEIPPSEQAPAPAGRMQFRPAEPEAAPAPAKDPRKTRQGPGPVEADLNIPELTSGAHWKRPGSQEATLVLVQRDGSDGESFAITGRSITIGRASADIRFPDDEFPGATHARIEHSDHGLTVIDLDSFNGVYLRISAPEPVYPGDVFLLGHQLLRLENVPESGHERAVPAGGVRQFGTPLPPAWGRLVQLGYGGSEAEVYYLRPRQVIFGREQGDIVFRGDAFISRKHAHLTMELHGDTMSVMLEDLSSANGTYLRVRGSAHLEDGDMFRVGDQIFRVRMA